MPKRLVVAPHLGWILEHQDQLISRAQATAVGMSKHAIANRMRYDGWHAVLPGVFLTHAGDLTRRQMLIAALLWAGPEAAIDGRDACRFHGVKAVSPDEHFVEIVIPPQGTVRSTGFVRVRRAGSYQVVKSERLRYVDAATAVIATTRRLTNGRAALAVISDALQRRACTELDLLTAHVQGPPRNAALTDQALAAVGLGARSVPEVRFQDLAVASSILPPLLYNPLLRLPDGRLISPDALAEEAALVHETNGRQAHGREDLFEDLQERHQVMTVAGLTVLHNTPRQLWIQGRRIITGFETCYIRDRGRGLPPGVVLLRRGPEGCAATAG